MPGATEQTLSFAAVESQTGNRYRARLSNPCGDPFTTTAGLLTVTRASVGGVAFAASSAVCPGRETSISLSQPTGNIIDWESSLDGAVWNRIHTAANPLNTGVLTAATRYRAVVQNGSCPTALSTVAAVELNSPVDAESFGNQSVCAGESVSFTTRVRGGGPYEVLWKRGERFWGREANIGSRRLGT